MEPKFKVPKRPSKLDAFADKLSLWLKAEAGKSRKQRRTVKQLHADLVALGYDGSYGRVAAFARAWKAERQREQQSSGRGTFVPLVFQPGEAFQFDWSEDWAVMGGERTKLQVAQFKLSSQPRLHPAGLSAADARDAVRRPRPCVPGVGRRAAARHLRQHADGGGPGWPRQGARRSTPASRAMVSHYLFDAEFCNPASGWEKGQVEKNVQDARHRLWQRMPCFADLDALNDWLEQRCMALWERDPAWHPARTRIADVVGERAAAA